MKYRVYYIESGYAATEKRPDDLKEASVQLVVDDIKKIALLVKIAQLHEAIRLNT